MNRIILIALLLIINLSLVVDVISSYIDDNQLVELVENLGESEEEENTEVRTKVLKELDCYDRQELYSLSLISDHYMKKKRFFEDASTLVQHHSEISTPPPERNS